MKKTILLLIVIFIINAPLFAQLPITQTFGTTGATPAGWTLLGDWAVDVGDPSSAYLSDCNVGGSSAGGKLVALNSSGGASSATFTFSGTGKTNITISWNEWRDDITTPVLTVLTSTDNFVTSTTLTPTEPAAGAWAAVAAMVLPSSFDNQSAIQIRFQYTPDNSGLFDGFDDLSITGTNTPIFYLKAASSASCELLASWGDNADGTGNAPPNFTNSGQEFNIGNSSTASISGAWSVSGTSQLIINTGTNFTIPAGNALTLTTVVLTVQNASTLTLQHTTSYLSAASTSLATNSTVDFAQASSVNLWSGATFQNLTISGGANKTCSGATTISGILNLNGSNLGMAAGVRLTLNGTKTGSGKLVAANGNLTIGGTGTFGTLDFTSASPLIRSLTLDRTSSGLVTLGNNLTLNTTASALTNGTLDLNGYSLSMTGPITFGSGGSLKGSSSSSLSITGAFSITGNLTMDQTSSSTKTLADLTLNRSGQTLKLGGDLIVATNAVFTNGIIDINDFSLTLNGPVTFPTVGNFIGSTNSNLLIGGSGAVAGTFSISQTSALTRNLYNFSFDRSGQTFQLGSSDLIVANAATFTNGIIDLNGKSLTLNGAITFQTSGNFKGSTTSSVSIGGSGSITNNFPMDQTSSATKSLHTLSFNRSGQNLILAGDLIVNNVGTLTSGVVDINGKTLTLSGTATFGGATFKGSSASSVLVNASTITGSFPMDATSKTLKVLAINSAAAFSLGSALEITDSLSIKGGSAFTTGGFLKLKAVSGLVGRIAEITGSISGNATVENFIPGTTPKWKNLGAPGISGLTVNDWDGGSGSATDFAMTCIGCINGTTTAGNFASIQQDPTGTGSYSVCSNTTALTPGVGFWLYDASTKTTAINVTQTKTGAVVSGAVVSGTKFMSNPYPSAISVDRLKSHTSITSVDVYNGSGYTTFNGGIPSAAVIPMGQAFYANGVAGTITFQESDKVSFNTTNILKAAANPTIGTVFELDLNSAYNELDKTYIRFHNNGTVGFDHDLDGYKRYATPGYRNTAAVYSKYTTIATIIGGEDYAINSLPYSAILPTVLPVRVKVSYPGSFTITPIDIANLPSGVCVTLKDKLLNINHDLRTGVYICSINDTTNAPRFELTICSSAITTDINNSAVNNSNTTLINQDINGAYVQTNFEKMTKATISAFNVMGQKLMADKEVEGKDLTTYLDLGDVHGQVVIIRVTYAKENVTKKIFIN